MTITASIPTRTVEPGRITRPKRVSAIPTLTTRRLALSLRNPRSVAVPVLTPLLFALVIAPALANTIANPGARTGYMTYVALATMGLLIPLNCMFSGLGVIVDRPAGAMRELLVAPIRRSSIVVGNLPLTHALALFRYGLTGHAGVKALHNIWGMSNVTMMAGLSLLVVTLYAVAIFATAVRLFTKAGTS